MLNKIQVTDVPFVKAETWKGSATIGEVTQKEIANGYEQVSIPFAYEDASGTDRTFTHRVNVRPEWFDAGYKAPNQADFEKGTPEYNEAISYSINMQRFVRKLFAELGLDTIDFDTLEGHSIGISLGPQSAKRDPSVQELKSVYKLKG